VRRRFRRRLSADLPECELWPAILRDAFLQNSRRLTILGLRPTLVSIFSGMKTSFVKVSHIFQLLLLCCQFHKQIVESVEIEIQLNAVFFYLHAINEHLHNFRLLSLVKVIPGFAEVFQSQHKILFFEIVALFGQSIHVHNDFW
jgi:hypothetical protein